MRYGGLVLELGTHILLFVVYESGRAWSYTYSCWYCYFLWQWLEPNYGRTSNRQSSQNWSNKRSNSLQTHHSAHNWRIHRQTSQIKARRSIHSILRRSSLIRCPQTLRGHAINHGRSRQTWRALRDLVPKQTLEISIHEPLGPSSYERYQSS